MSGWKDFLCRQLVGQGGQASRRRFQLIALAMVMSPHAVGDRVFDSADLSSPQPPFTQSLAQADTESPAGDLEASETLDSSQLLLLSGLIRERADRQAYAMAMDLRLAFEGEPDFDILYARAAMNVNEYQRAAFALERALIVFPRDLDVRLMLVEAYLGLRNTSAARRQIDLLRDREQSTAQQRRLASLERRLVRQEMAAREQDTFTVGAQLQYFTNINSGLGFSSTTLDVDGGSIDFEPSEDAQAQAAPAITLQSSYERTRPLTQRVRSNIAAGVTAQLSSFEDANNVGALLSYGRESTRGWSGDVQFIPSWNADGVQATTALNARQQRLIGPVTGGLSLAWTAADDQSLQLQSTLSDAVTIAPVSLPWQVSTSVTVSENASQNNLGLGGQLQPSWSPAGSFTYQGGLSAQYQWFLEDDTAGDTNLQNLQLQAEATAFRPVLTASLLSLRVAYEQNISNQVLNEFSGFEISVGYQQSW